LSSFVREKLFPMYAGAVGMDWTDGLDKGALPHVGGVVTCRPKDTRIDQVWG